MNLLKRKPYSDLLLFIFPECPINAQQEKNFNGEIR